MADPLLSNSEFGQTLATPCRSRTRLGGRGLGTRFRGPDGALKRRGARTWLRPPVPDRQPASAWWSGENRGRDPSGAGSAWFATLRRAAGVTERFGVARLVEPGMAWPWSEAREALEGKQSPWKDRMSNRWQRRGDITDSSAEQSLGVGCFAFFRQVRPRPLRWSVALGGVSGDFGCQTACHPHLRGGAVGLFVETGVGNAPSLGA